ncbi:MAG: flavodoxin domain-containing protein [Tenuifilaceae bacterium]|jgi:menaquinone-dependent protoporphyrinogen oxidase|nr:flavodoxin domain-containing protein [Tenuifilaceae bacterium]
MKTAIIYATSHGTSEKVAQQIQVELGNNAQLFNLKQNKIIDLTPFKTVVIGGSIHAGQMQGRVKKFCKRNLVELLKKRIALYMVGMNEPEFEAEFNNAFPELLRNHSISSKCVGGEFLLEKMNFFEKLIVKKVSGVDKRVSKIDEEKIKELVKEIKE